MDGRWLTYKELAAELGASAEGARRRAQRGRWTRQRGNDGLARVLVPEDALDGPRPVRAPSVRPDGAGNARAPDAPLVAALESHVATLKAELEHRAAELDALKAQLAAADASASEGIHKLEVQLAAERERADKAISAFERLAERLEAMAAAKRPWWRRLAG